MLLSKKTSAGITLRNPKLWQLQQKANCGDLAQAGKPISRTHKPFG